LGVTDLVYALDSIIERVDLSKVFVRPQRLEVELGSGDGSFLVEYAKRHPETNFIGVERLLGRIRKLDRKGRRAGLANLRGVRLESGYFVRYLLPQHSVGAFHIYFPDPWPKRKHRRHRLINEQFAAAAYDALVPDGKMYLRTDDPDYFSQMTAVFDARPDFARIETPVELAGLPTDFERDFNARGITTLLVAYRALQKKSPQIQGERR
jgi:tRNA (guanine-N7-)-methyltransferase